LQKDRQTDTYRWTDKYKFGKTDVMIHTEERRSIGVDRCSDRWGARQDVSMDRWMYKQTDGWQASGQAGR
jgi:hypothetical protein